MSLGTTRVVNGYESESFDHYKKNAKGVVKDFCLGKEQTKLLQEKIDKCQTFNEVNRVLKEAREML